jgi:hypothetical protein
MEEHRKNFQATLDTIKAYWKRPYYFDRHDPKDIDALLIYFYQRNPQKDIKAQWK